MKSQVNAVKLYTRWARPYLKAAEELAMMDKGRGEANLIHAFNTIILELMVFGISKANIQKSIGAGIFPRRFWHTKLKRDYYSCVFVDFSFRGMPRVSSRQESSHYVHIGRAKIIFKAFNPKAIGSCSDFISSLSVKA